MDAPRGDAQETTPRLKKKKKNVWTYSFYHFPTPLRSRGNGSLELLEGIVVFSGSCESLASSGFCKVSQALRFLGPGSRASAAQRSWRRSPGAGDLISSTRR